MDYSDKVLNSVKGLPFGSPLIILLTAAEIPLLLLFPISPPFL